MYQIERKNLDRLFASIAAAQDLILPIRKASETNFALWGEDQEVDLDTLKTVKTGKDAFFPQSETLYTCERDGKKLTVKPEELCSRPFVIFGMKCCDAKGIEVLDRVFLSDPVDSFYKARRQHGTIVTLGCRWPEESCFCKVYGIDYTEPKEIPVTDVAVWLTDEMLYWDPVTQKGQALTDSLKDLLKTTDASEDDRDASAETAMRQLGQEKASARALEDQLPYMHLSLDGWNGNATQEKFDSPLWEELCQGCLGCGTCTFICPTCQCYDIKDYDTGHGVQRYRCWDSCMYSDFTMMAASNNRTTQMQRFRQRFMHKLVYFPANNDGMYSCVGCGRCVEKCPQSLNIVKVIKAFEKEKTAGGESK